MSAREPLLVTRLRMSNTMTSPPSLKDITLPEIQRLLDAGALTSTQLVHTYLARINGVDHEFNSVIETNPDAITDAQARDAERAAGKKHSNLHGLPILLKDNIPTLDNTETTCGSLALIGARPPEEATVVTALHDAGAIILGKANMAEWVGFRSTSGCSGWSPRGGQTYGPYIKDSKASGSSSGSAVATALGLCFAAIGTETCWSIVSPAEKSGIVGYKPTKDLIPSDGIIYASKKQDTVGMLTRTVEDAVLITNALVAAIGGTELLRLLPENTSSSDYADRILDALRSKRSITDLRSLRIAVPTAMLYCTPGFKLEAFGRALWRLENNGATVVNRVIIPGLCEYADLSQQESQIVLDTDMKIAINDYLSNLRTNPQNINDLQDLIDFTKTCPEEGYPARNVAGLERAQATDPNSELYKAMLKKDEHLAGCISNALDRYSCDVLLIPFLSPVLQTFAAKAGSPVLSVPLSVYPEDTPVVIDSKNGLIIEASGLP
jgi:amidase